MSAAVEADATSLAFGVSGTVRIWGLFERTLKNKKMAP